MQIKYLHRFPLCFNWQQYSSNSKDETGHRIQRYGSIVIAMKQNLEQRLQKTGIISIPDKTSTVDIKLMYIHVHVYVRNIL